MDWSGGSAAAGEEGTDVVGEVVGVDGTVAVVVGGDEGGLCEEGADVVGEVIGVEGAVAVEVGSAV